MKTQKATLKDKTTEEIATMLAAELETVRKIGFNAGMTRTKDVKQGRTSKKLIAQLKTELASRAE
jgi:ribosomal protein L29